MWGVVSAGVVLVSAKRDLISLFRFNVLPNHNNNKAKYIIWFMNYNKPRLSTYEEEWSCPHCRDPRTESWPLFAITPEMQELHRTNLIKTCCFLDNALQNGSNADEKNKNGCNNLYILTSYYIYKNIYSGLKMRTQDDIFWQWKRKLGHIYIFIYFFQLLWAFHTTHQSAQKGWSKHFARVQLFFGSRFNAGVF